MTFGRTTAGFSIAMLSAIGAPASAQSLPQSSTGAPTREEVERDRTPANPRSTGNLTVEGGIERASCPLAAPEFQNLNVTISEVQFAGLQIVSPDILRPAYQAFLGKSVPIATVCEIRDAAATILRREGYLAAVQVPPQRIDNGVVRFDVLMARVVRIQVRGDAGRSERIIAGYLDRIREQPVFNIRDAERYLLLARDLPGYDVRLTLRPAGTVPGEVIGDVTVVRVPVQVDANFQNYGSKDVGRFGGLARVQFNGLTGLGDSTSVSAFTTADFKEQQVIQAGHAFKLGRDGLAFAGNFTYAWTRPDLGGGLRLRSRTLVGSLEASYPFIRSQAANLYGAAGFDLINQDVRFGGQPFNRDRLRVAFLRLDFDRTDQGSVAGVGGYSISEPRARLGASIELRQGVGILDATTSCAARADACALLPTPSRVEGDPTAFVARASVTFEYRPTPKLTFSLSPRAQYAPHALLSYEEFSAGNYTVGRGYDPGTLVGDSGVGVQAEARVGRLAPKGPNAFAFQPYGFVDAAWVWNKDSAFNGLDPQKLYSAGGGVRAAFGDRFRLDTNLAVPLKRAGLQARRGGVRFLVSLTAQLVPWTRR